MEFISKRGIVKTFTNERGYKNELTVAQLAKYMDHTMLKPNATKQYHQCTRSYQIQHGFSLHQSILGQHTADRLKDTDVNTCTVIGFPLGASTTKIKVAEAVDAIENGADEIDMVINIGELKSGHQEIVEQDIREVAQAVHAHHKLLKVIIETCLLTDEEKTIASKLTMDGGADFVKTSTGFSTGGAKAEDVTLMRKAVGPDFKIKASGGIHHLDEAYAMIEAGANRLGVSASVQILEEAARQ